MSPKTRKISCSCLSDQIEAQMPLFQSKPTWLSFSLATAASINLKYQHSQSKLLNQKLELTGLNYWLGVVLIPLTLKHATSVQRRFREVLGQIDGHVGHRTGQLLRTSPHFAPAELVKCPAKCKHLLQLSWCNLLLGMNILLSFDELLKRHIIIAIDTKADIGESSILDNMHKRRTRGYQSGYCEYKGEGYMGHMNKKLWQRPTKSSFSSASILGRTSWGGRKDAAKAAHDLEGWRTYEIITKPSTGEAHSYAPTASHSYVCTQPG